MRQEITIAFCLMLVFEGVMPFLAPARWRAMVAGVAQLPDRSLRAAGFASMLAGTVLLYVFN